MDIEQVQAERQRRKAEKRAELERRRLEQLPKLNELELEHGDENVRAMWAGDALVVVRRPKATEFAMYTDKAGAGGTDAQETARRIRTALATLARQCLVHPDEVAFRELCKVHPGLETDAGNAARALGDDAEVLAEGKS